MKKSPLSRLIFPLDQLLEASKNDSSRISVFTEAKLEPVQQANHLIQEFTKIIEKVPEEIFQDQCLGDNPELNVKTIVQSRLLGNSWKSLAKQFSVSESRLRIFWYRSVKEMTPKLKEYLSEGEAN